MSEDRRVATAALCVSAVLLWLALPGRPPLPKECTEPGERASRGGWTLKAGCGPESGGLPPVRGPARRLFGLPLDPNRASPASLETLPGIGPVTAEKIVAYREENGPFRRIEDIQDVPGIGPATFVDEQDGQRKNHRRGDDGLARDVAARLSTQHGTEAPQQANDDARG